MIRPLSLALLAALVLSLIGAATATASASPDALRVLMVETSANPEGSELREQIEAQPGVATVDLIERFSEPLPEEAQLKPYDIVVSGGDNGLGNLEAATKYGDALAGYIDGGGVLFQYAYENWNEVQEEEIYGPRGRFYTGDYTPVLGGPNPNRDVSVDTSGSSDPLLAGVGLLTSESNTEPDLATDATSVAQWEQGGEAIDVKGRVVSTSAFLGDGDFTGDYGRLVVNAARMPPPEPPTPPAPLTPIAAATHVLTVTNSNPIGGLVSGTGGPISCGTICAATFPSAAGVSLYATPSKVFAFAGFSGACAGTVCDLTMDADKSVAASFVGFSPLKKVSLNQKKGTGTLKVKLGAPGSLLLTGKKLKKQSKTAKAAGTLKVPLLAKGGAKRALTKKGKAKVSYELSFTPTGGTSATVKGAATLRQQIAG